MVRYRKTGSEMSFTLQTTGGAAASISNTGMTFITSTAAERYVLAPPVAGCRKTIIFSAGTNTTGRVIELSSASSDDSITMLGATGGTATITELTIDTTGICSVELVGLASTQWKLLYQTSGIPAALSTGFVYAAS